MKFDPVHDSQAAFRKMLRALSRPGLVENISTQAACVDVQLGIEPALLVLALVLLDAETSFHWDGPGAESATETLSRLCYATAKPAEDADFIFAVGGEQALARAFSLARLGSLIDPHQGATLIGLVDSIKGQGTLALSGPGIEGESRVSLELSGGSDSWLERRAERNMEFPLGIDAFLVGRDGSLLGIPRTTKIGRVS